MKDRVLVIAAHPDDEVLGCGGTISKLIKEGCKVYTLILGEGITSRDAKRDKSKRASEIKNLKKQTAEANKILGVEKVFTFDFPDNRFDTVPLLDIVKKVEEVKKQVKPTIIFTHHHNDLNVDHIITRKAALTATRPMKNETVKTIYAFEILSSTEWNYPLSFSPNVFFDVSKTFKLKTKALKCYKDELRKPPHPRSLEAIELNAKMWGPKAGAEYAEAFELVRQIN
jgi:LmbE family N-acetylglucosaminyl deacetylase